MRKLKHDKRIMLRISGGTILLMVKKMKSLKIRSLSEAVRLAIEEWVK